MTEADRIVAAARKRTFGIHDLPQVLFQQTYRQAQIDTMQGVEDGSLAALWRARDVSVEEAQLDRVRDTVTLAWDDQRLLIKTDMTPRPGDRYVYSRYWDGKEGWLGETTSDKRHVYRYSELGKLTEHVTPFYFPHWVAAGGRLPWSGPEVVLAEYKVAPSLTRYRLVDAETIDGSDCDVYEGPERQEKIWIDRASGLIKAVSWHYVSGFTQAENWKVNCKVAGREFTNEEAYAKWYKALGPTELKQFNANWAAATWPRATPFNLLVFSEYREISPGVQWPMNVERINVLKEDHNGKKYYFTRAEINISEQKTDFVIRDLAVEALPAQGIEVTDHRTEIPIDYVWKEALPEALIEELREEQLAERQAKEEVEDRINVQPIDSVEDAIVILVQGPKTDPTKVWARAIKYLVDHKQPALPALIVELDSQDQDHPISKIAFALRAIGDRRAVPALIRALPRTLQPSRSDYGLLLDDPDLCAFMQRHSRAGRVNPTSNCFDYGRAFREVTEALHRLSDQNFGEMELNWVHLADTESQRVQQRKLFRSMAQRWADWWEANWVLMIDDVNFDKVELPPIAEMSPKFAERRQPSSGPGVKLQEGHSNWIVQSVHESSQRCFVDLDTGREVGWPKSLPSVEEIGIDSPELLAWARKEGFDMMGVSHTPKGENQPLYCLQPIDMSVWQIDSNEHRSLQAAMSGEKSYPLSRPVELMVPLREVKRPYDYQYGGVAFLYVTREGTAGLIRMTGQVNDTNVVPYAAYSQDDRFSSVGYYHGAKISFAAMTEAKGAGP